MKDLSPDQVRVPSILIHSSAPLYYASSISDARILRAQGSRLINSWNFLYTFARPLGLVTVPSLPELVKALRVLELETGDEDEKYEAERLWQEVCVTLVRAVAPEVETLVGLRGSSNTANIQDLFSRKTGLLLPFNCLTWPEIARLCLLVSIYRELNFTGEYGTPDLPLRRCVRS